MDWLSSNNSFPQKELPEKQKFWKLSVVITESNHIPKKLSGQEIILPQKGPSTECEFIFTPQNLKEFEGFIVVSYKQRVLQIATLKIPIIENESKLSPSDSISLTNQALLYRLEDGEKRAKVDLSLITNKTAELTMILPSSAFQYKLDNCKDITISINEKISQIANSEEDYENGYESKKGQQLLKDLIIRGRTLYEQILNKELEEKCEQLQYIQIISNNDVKNTIPFEFIYDREYPHESATLCKIWNQCPSPPNCTEKDFKEILCPFGFWGLNKLIERHIISTSHASKNKPYIEKEELSKRGKFKISEPCLIAASHHVKPEDLEKIASTVLELTGFPPVKANWDNWIEMIKAFKPRLIIVLPHMEAISEFEATLEINTKKKPYRDITEAHIRANAEYRPIVALLGCDTAGTEFKYIDFVQTLVIIKQG